MVRQVIHFPKWPISWIISEDERGLTALLPSHNQDLAAGAIALRRGVLTRCLPAEVAGHVWKEPPNARSSLCRTRMSEPELLPTENEDHHRPLEFNKLSQHVPQAHGPQRDEVAPPVRDKAWRLPLPPNRGSSSTVGLPVSKPNFSVRIRAPPPFCSTVFDLQPQPSGLIYKFDLLETRIRSTQDFLRGSIWRRQ